MQILVHIISGSIKENPVKITTGCNNTVCNGIILLGEQSHDNIDDIQEIYVNQYFHEDRTPTMTIELGSSGDPQLGKDNE